MTVTSKRKLRKEVTEKKEREVYISSEECLPKQFALAKLFKELETGGISDVKYLNPYKIRVTFDQEKNIKDLLNIEGLRSKGWRMSKSSEVSYSYGVIKYVDLEHTNEEIIKNISCPDPADMFR